MDEISADDWCRLNTLGNALVIAPPGCGKTELLARRAAACVGSGLISPGRKILAVTFTNKARDNLASRMQDHVGRGFRRHVSVVNFQGIALNLYRRHRYVLPDSVQELLPDDRALRQLERRTFDEYRVPRDAQQEFQVSIRTAKAGAFSDAEVMERLEESGLAAACWYERQLQSEGRMDHDDVLRLGLRVLKNEQVAALYAERYAYVLVDEAQDLTRVQYDLVKPLGREGTVFAGDRAQGIYAFAGADPDWVFERIESRKPVRIRLSQSYRSSPEVLAVVSAIAAELGGEELTSAELERWRGHGRALVASFAGQRDEAAWLVKQIESWREQAAGEVPPRGITVGVLSRMKPGGRRDVFLAQAQAAGIDVEVWVHPLHRPEVVQLIRKHLDAVLATVPEGRAQVEELYLRCVSEVAAENASTLIDLKDAADELVAEIEVHDLRPLVDRIRVASDVSMPVGPGVHLLTGHSGKGQGFDKVIVLGFKEGQTPSFFVKGLPDNDPMVREELALLHVIAGLKRPGIRGGSVP
ncbi:UvrD-helicase domain-containing protein [Ilumatobacter sp.]|uniref:UvrD-helicase domain-containing protein n=1 Tax=Ilumatobacter sp. TaxID=1967498 RepID=UPI003B519B77